MPHRETEQGMWTRAKHGLRFQSYFLNRQDLQFLCSTKIRNVIHTFLSLFFYCIKIDFLSYRNRLDNFCKYKTGKQLNKCKLRDNIFDVS